MDGRQGSGSRPHRRWSDTEKRWAVAESFQAGVSVSIGLATMSGSAQRGPATRISGATTVGAGKPVSLRRPFTHTANTFRIQKVA